MFTKDTLEALRLADAITQAAESVRPVSDRAAALPSDFKLHDLEHLLLLRTRPRGTMTTNSLPDFVQYAVEYSEVEEETHTAASIVFIEEEAMQAVAVLNLGTTDKPGHADNRAVLKLRPTAAYLALKGVAGVALPQAKAAEFLEDWANNLTCFDETGAQVPTGKAIASVRKITIESARKVETEEKSLSTSRSAFESVRATNTEAIPATIDFICTPYHGLSSRKFVLRFSIQTGGDKPAIVLRLVKAEQHAEEMAAEFAQGVRIALKGASSALIDSQTPEIPVLVGTYKTC